MGNQEDYENKIDLLKAIEESRVKRPHNVPVGAYLQEADNLYIWALDDREALTAAGLSWEFVEDLPVRRGALAHAEAIWQSQWKAEKESAREWAERSPLAYELRYRMLKDFRFAFRNDPDLTKLVGRIGKGRTHANMLQGLNDLCALGEAHTSLLEAINFDLSLLDRADREAYEMADLLARATRDRLEHNEGKEIRDRAYTHLKEAMDEVRVHGQFVFRENKERFWGYGSQHLREAKQKRARKRKKTEAAKNDTAGREQTNEINKSISNGLKILDK